MQISNIDKDFIEIVDRLDQNGFKPYASCDGVVANHTKEHPTNGAYLAFLESPKILDLLAACRRDPDSFKITLSDNSHDKPHELYGNIISGNNYAIHFENRMGERTEYFRKIMEGIISGEIQIPESEKVALSLINEVLQEEDSELCFSVTDGAEYQPFMKKQGRAVSLLITTKEKDDNLRRSMRDLEPQISRKYGIPAKKDDFSETFDEDEFIVTCFDNCSLEIYFKELNVGKIRDIIRFARSVERGLPTFEAREPDYDELDYDDSDYYEVDSDDPWEL